MDKLRTAIPRESWSTNQSSRHNCARPWKNQLTTFCHSTDIFCVATDVESAGNLENASAPADVGGYKNLFFKARPDRTARLQMHEPIIRSGLRQRAIAPAMAAMLEAVFGLSEHFVRERGDEHFFRAKVFANVIRLHVTR
jgi:hypothetical protein